MVPHLGTLQFLYHISDILVHREVEYIYFVYSQVHSIQNFIR